MLLAVRRERGHEQLTAFADSLDLEAHELVLALAQSFRGLQPLPIDESVDALAQGSRSRMRMNRQGCISPTLGARWAAASSRSSSAASSGSLEKWRMSRRAVITRYRESISSAGEIRH